MIRDITIGQYYPEDTVIHRMDPRLKLIGTFVYIISMFCFHRFFGFLVCAAFLALVIHVSKVPFSYIVKGLKPIAMILLFTMAVHILFSSGTPIVSFGVIHITWKGIRQAIFMGIRLCLLVFGASMMTFTTTPNQLTDGIEKLFHPLNKIHVPVHEIAMMMSIALRFIPILLEETDKIMKAQMARGADFETGGLIKKAKALVPLLVPLFVAAFRRADDLAMAMEARCYRGGEGRTKMKPLKYKSVDAMGYAAVLGYVVVLFVVVRFAPTIWSMLPYPQ